MWKRIDEHLPEHYQNCLVSDGKSWPVCAISNVFDTVTWIYPRPELVEAGYTPEWWMPMPRLPQRSDVMRNGVLAILFLFVVAPQAHAGPFSRRTVATTRASTCVGGNCSSASSRTVTRGGAQGHAEAMAASGSMVHAASHPGYEGVGVGGSPQAALGACCDNGGAVLDEGTAQGRDGRWYACRRYSQR